MRRLFPTTNFVAPFLVPGDRLCVAEAPGQEEAERGEPLVGPSGSWLFGREAEDGKRSGGLYRAAGVDTAIISKCNVIQCRPPNNHFPTDIESRAYISKEEAEASVRQCLKNHVEPVLKNRSWKRVDCFGDKALVALTGQTGITRWRGSPLAIPACGPEPLTVPTLHPAYISRDQSMLPAVVKDLSKTLDVPEEHYNLQPSLEDVKTFTATEFCTDIETIMATDQITMVGLCAKAGHAMVVPPEGVFLTELKRIFANATEVVGQNLIAFDLPKLQKIGVEIPKECVVWDTLLMHHLCFPDLQHDLAFIGSFLTNKPAWKWKASEDERLYNARDCDVTWVAYRQLRPMLRAEGLHNLYLNVQVPLARICRLLHETGFRINPARLKEVRADLESKSLELEKELPLFLKTQEVPIRKRVRAPEGTLSEKTHKPLKYIMTDATESVTPWKSSDVLKNYLYEICQLPVQVHVKTGQPSTDKTALPKLIRAASKPEYAKLVGPEKAAEVLRALRVLQKIRQIASLLSTFVQDKWEDCGVERIHSSFNAHGTACLAPGTLVCREDLTWAPIENLKIGDTLWGFDEFSNGGTAGRRFKPTTILQKQLVTRPAYRVTLSNGVSVVATDDHKWLRRYRIKKERSTYSWITTDKLEAGEYLAFWEKPWEIETDLDAGYLKGILAGEGCVAKRTGGVRITQNVGITLDEIKDALTSKGYQFSTYTVRPRPRRQAQEQLYIGDELRLVGSTRPARLLKKLVQQLCGRRIQGKHGPVEVVDVEYLGVQEAVGLQTTTGTLIANGILSHNSGRLSSSDPNLQNIPKSVRCIYVPSYTDWVIINVDFASLENRLTALYANDNERLERLATKGFSEHRHNASVLFDIPYELVEKDDAGDSPYTKAKRVTHGLNYGEGPLKIAKINDLDFREVKQLCEKWKQANPRTIAWQQDTYEQAKKDGFLTTRFGRKRWFYGSNVYTECLSFLPQSSGADIIIRCMVALMYQRIGWPESQVQKVVQVYRALPHPARLLVTVHDSLVLEAPLDMVEQIKETLTTVLTQPWPEFGGYSFPVEIGTGPSWGECH